MPTYSSAEAITHVCRHCKAVRRYPHRHVRLFAEGGIGFRCEKCHAKYDDFGYDNKGHLVLTRAECKTIEEAASGQSQQPIRYATLRDAGFEPPSEDC